MKNLIKILLILTILLNFKDYSVASMSEIRPPQTILKYSQKNGLGWTMEDCKKLSSRVIWQGMDRNMVSYLGVSWEDYKQYSNFIDQSRGSSCNISGSALRNGTVRIKMYCAGSMDGWIDIKNGRVVNIH